MAGQWQFFVNKVGSVLARLKTATYYRLIFGSIGRRSSIFKPLLLSNPQFIFVGDRTMIRTGARIETVVLNKEQPPALIIGNNVNIEQNVHIICSSRIVIGDDVSITGGCAIVDTNHPYEDVSDPRKIGERLDANAIAPVEIGAGSFLGYGSVILPGVRIGKNCVVGANSIVTRDVPDFCVVCGNPARIVRRYDTSAGVWRKVIPTNSNIEGAS